MSDFQDERKINRGKPLFSLEIDDVLIQQIFQRFAEQIKSQSEEISFLKKELENRPKMDDFVNLSEAVVSLQKQTTHSSEVLENTVKDFKASMNERSESINQMMQTRLNEMLFSVNAAIRGELEMLDKSPMPTKQTLDDVNNLKLNFAKMNQKVDEIKDTIIQMAAAFDGEINIDKLSKKTVPSCIRCAANRDRTKLDENIEAVKRLKERIDSFEETFDRVLPYQDHSFPQFNNRDYNYDRKQSPTFPPLPQSVTSFDDFASYVSNVIPIIQTSIRGIHGYVSNLDAAVKSKVDKADYDTYQNQTQKTLSFIIQETDDYKEKKNNIVTKDDFQSLSVRLLDVVNGASKSSCTSTRCVACGKIVEHTADTNQNQQIPQFTKNVPPTQSRGWGPQRIGSARTERSVHISETNLADNLSVEPMPKIRTLRSAKSTITKRPVGSAF